MLKWFALAILSVGSLMFSQPGVPNHPGGHASKASDAIPVLPPLHVVIDPLHVLIDPVVERASPPPKPAEKDLPWFLRADWITAFCTAAYAFFSYRTLRAIERQARTMRQQTAHLRRSVIQARKAAKAALLNAEALINSERAWVTVEILQPKPDDMDIKAMPENRLIGVPFVYKNEGRTPAIVTDSYVRAVFVDRIGSPGSGPLKLRLDEVPDYSIEQDTNRIVQGEPLWLPRQRFRHLVSINQSLFEGEYEAYRSGSKVLCIYGFIQYRDVIGKSHVTRFCRVYDRRRPGRWINRLETGESLFPPAFVAAGPPEYNQAT